MLLKNCWLVKIRYIYIYIGRKKLNLVGYFVDFIICKIGYVMIFIWKIFFVVVFVNNIEIKVLNV